MFRLVLSHGRGYLRCRLCATFFALAVVLSSLPKEASAASYICIDSKGRFVERSKKCTGKFAPASISAIQSRLSLTTGPAGPAGPAGSAGISGRQLVTAQSVNESIAAQDTKTIVATCPLSPQKVAVGVACSSSNNSITVISNSLADGFGSFGACTFRNTSLFSITNATLTTTTVCAAVGDE